MAGFKVIACRCKLWHKGAGYNLPMKTSILGSLAVLALTLLCACGYKGALELPDDPEFKSRAKFPDVLLPSKSAEPPAKP